MKDDNQLIKQAFSIIELQEKNKHEERINFKEELNQHTKSNNFFKIVVIILLLGNIVTRLYEIHEQYSYSISISNESKSESTSESK